MKPSQTQKRNGFTMVEILVVMVIIGILVTLGGGSFMTAQQKGRDARRKSDLRQISNALELYANDHPVGPIYQYPDHNGNQIVGCGTSGVPTVCSWGSAFEQRVLPATTQTTYMPQLPVDPKSPTSVYRYMADTNGEWFIVFARLENTEDQNVPKTGGGQPMVYDGVMCGSLECNYAVSSSNIVATDQVSLVQE